MDDPETSLQAASSSATYESSTLPIHQAVSAWFLGPQAENSGLLKEIFAKIVGDHVNARSSYHPEDGVFITDEVKSSPIYQQMVQNLRTSLDRLSSLLNDRSIPSYSPRYGAHMSFEPSLPSIAGWLSAMLLNPNNVSFEAGPITTLLELEVGRELCRMIGFKDGHEEGEEWNEGQMEGDIKSWGHLTSDGTVANIEAIWAARNLKFYPLALWRAMYQTHPLNFLAKSFKVPSLTSKKPVLFSSLSTWDLLNLPSATILSIPDRLRREYGVSSQFLEETLAGYLVQSTGMSDMMENVRKASIAGGEWGVRHNPKLLIANTKHYSWAKAVSLAGIGSKNLVGVPVDSHARISISALRSVLEHHLSTRKPIYAVVATIGTTEEGAIDPIRDILELREEFEKRGLSFVVHADAAWGGYFTSTIRDPPEEWHSTWPGNAPVSEPTPFDSEYPPSLTLKPYSAHQLQSLGRADSVTVDSHKSGYCPYPSGGLCYRDRRMRHLLTWSAPYVQHGKRGESIGMRGVEGSKPGAAAAAVYMHHSVVGLHKRGHGGLLGEVSFTCARIAAHWATMSDSTTPYTVTPFNPLRFEPHLGVEHVPGVAEAHPSQNAEQVRERLEQAWRLVEDEKAFIKARILGKSNEELVRDTDPAVMAELKALGSDLNINAFVCNFRVKVPKGSRAKGNLGMAGEGAKSDNLGKGGFRAWFPSEAADPDGGFGRAGTTDVGGDGNRRFSFTSTSSRGAGTDMTSGDVYPAPGEDEDNEEEEGYEWVLNDDVAESNYLNRCIFDRLSVADIGHAPQDTPMFISSAILKAQDYGDCLKRFKERAGLETDSGMDLFVLRNVVMSPFQAGAGFVQKLADTFKEVLEECLKPVVTKNIITPQIHRFVMQGTDRLFLAYQPTFHKANGRHQLILEVEVRDMAQWEAYQAAREQHPNAVFELWTRPKPVTLEEVLEGGKVPCLVFADKQIVLNMTISAARVLKNRSLLSRHLDTSYDAHSTPFYLYGTRAQPHIDHMLLKAPNAQFTGENVCLELDQDIPEEKLANGVLLYVLGRPERSMQPFERDRDALVQRFFYPEAEYEVMVCDDPFPATSQGPGLATAIEHRHPVIAHGSMKLPLNIFVDMTNLNREDFRDDQRIVQRMEDGMNWEDRSAWSAMVAGRLDLPNSEYFASNANHGVDGEFNDGKDISKHPFLKREVSREKDVDVDAAGYN